MLKQLGEASAKDNPGWKQTISSKLGIEKPSIIAPHCLIERDSNRA
jgi:hypothetical protein